MLDDKKNTDQDPKDKKTGEFRVPPRTWILWIAILGSIPLLIVLRDKVDTGGKQLEQPEFVQKLDAGLIISGRIIYPPQGQLVDVIGKYYPSVDPEGKPIPSQTAPFKATLRLYPELETKLLVSGASV